MLFSQEDLASEKKLLRGSLKMTHLDSLESILNALQPSAWNNVHPVELSSTPSGMCLNFCVLLESDNLCASRLFLNC